MAGAVQLVLKTDLSSSRSLIPFAVNDSSGAYGTGAKSVLRATITEHAGRLVLNTTIADNSTQQNRSVFQLQGPASAGILPLLNDAAKRLDGGAVPFSTRNNRALEDYVAGFTAADAKGRVASLKDAIALDPSFGLAYIALADVLSQAAPQQLPELLKTATSNAPSFAPLDRARLNALVARYSHAPLAQQEADFRNVLALAPDESDALITVGSLAFLRGDAASGTKYLQRALELDPGNVNIRRALANGLFETRQFAQAEKILVGLDNNSAVLPELAICVFLEGDLARANTIAERMFASLQNPDAKTLFHAIWLELSGQYQKADDMLATATFAQPSMQAIAYSERAVWHMMAHDATSAKLLAAKAQQLDSRPGSFSSAAALLVAANSPVGSWKDAVNRSSIAGGQQAKDLVNAYGLFLGEHYADAAPAWTDILQRSGGADLHARAMLAASLSHEGEGDQARRINVQPFVPDFGDLYAPVSFLEMNRDLGIGVR